MAYHMYRMNFELGMLILHTRNWDLWFLVYNSLQTMEVKNDYAYVTTQRILNKFIEINFSMGCMVSTWTTSKNIDKIGQVI